MQLAVVFFQKTAAPAMKIRDRKQYVDLIRELLVRDDVAADADNGRPRLDDDDDILPLACSDTTTTHATTTTTTTHTTTHTTTTTILPTLLQLLIVVFLLACSEEGRWK